MLIDFIAGTTSDLYSITPVIRAIEKEQDAGKDFGYRLIYTGSNVKAGSENSSLLSTPNVFLDVAELSEGAAAAATITRYEKLLNTGLPDVVMIAGHSTEAMACALVASKIHNLRIAHMGSGMRSYNRNSEEEINRRIIDAITDYHFPVAQSASENLRNEGVSDDYIFFIGNPVADMLHIADKEIAQPAIWDILQLQQKRYILMNLEHPKVAGSPSRLKSLLLNIIRLSRNLPIIIPANEVSGKTLNIIGIKAPNLHFVQLPDETTLLYLTKYARLVITDDERLQDESTILQVPCITLLKSVARHETYTAGFNDVTGLQPEAIADAFHKLFEGNWKKGRIPYMWDGNAAERLVSVLKRLPDN